jgi:hypothetical protein
MISVNGWDLLPIYEFSQVLTYLGRQRALKNKVPGLTALMMGDPHTKAAERQVKAELVKAVSRLPKTAPEGIRQALTSMRDILVKQRYPPMKVRTIEESDAEDKAAALAMGVSEEEWNQIMVEVKAERKRLEEEGEW